MPITLQTSGRVCPFPLVEAKDAIAAVPEGDDLTIHFDCTQATDAIPRWAAQEGCPVTDYRRIGDAEWSITLQKKQPGGGDDGGATCPPSSSARVHLVRDRPDVGCGPRATVPDRRESRAHLRPAPLTTAARAAPDVHRRRRRNPGTRGSPRLSGFRRGVRTRTGWCQ
ncbi:sulfurtransferase TusA family protein [Georgenia satyanarayanai]|uniref:sulfurtransferase TusA family protein n=1 Tax=Georgenia satyanarayanai TaxID=860221 RepID=UPI0027DF7B1F|nr:sulfurtransferase TusA family protein [Georgenia satyanarayanai]